MRWIAILVIVVNAAILWRHIRKKHERMRRRHSDLDEGYMLNMSMNYDTVERYGKISRKMAMPVPDSSWKKFEKDMPEIEKESRYVLPIAGALITASLLYLFRTWNSP